MVGSAEEFEGIIMYRRDYRERDQLIKILTDRVGKTMFFVKNVRKRGSRIAADVLPFTDGNYVGVLNREGLSFINTALETHHFYQITQDIVKNAYATYILGLVDSAFADQQQLGGWFHQIKQALTLIDEGFDERIITNIIEIQLLNVFGIAPNWQGCSVCGRNDLPLDYSIKYGGLLCQEHYHLDSYRLHVDQRTIYYLRKFSRLNLDQLTSIEVHEETKKHLRQVIDEIYDDGVGLRLKSKKFIDQLGTWENKLPPLTNDD
ncbi:DNA repair protein RecO [Paucilactobacillus suebicus]|uniref:DNA repair protein RecO n=1 Tax=Paucilactobacillus suebicus DSM 5007 = KCTC 3549 TaxID=1423807 RepID=A0A0R1W353_9LACO|nr:DNA repair protein RecO [Paucilactobacillus suebicus]KRM12090.1 recombination protein O [Paucilactobacillus suebicus DSM 5007 = KCTC 3549]